jgi:hypothetical protein
MGETYMTEQEINCAIAEARGWKWVENHCFRNESFMGSKTYGDGWKNPKTGKVSDDAEDLPDYCSDHNAIHEARNSLTPDQQEIYAKTLLGYDIANVDGTTDWTAAFDLHNKTPRECAEAFLRTIGKWKD